MELRKSARSFAAVATIASVVLAAGVLPRAAAAQQNKKPGGASKGVSKVNKTAERQMARLEKVVGHPLTPLEKAQVITAYLKKQAADKATNESFMAAVARATGVSEDQLKARDKQMRDEERAKQRAAMAGAQAAAKK